MKRITFTKFYPVSDFVHLTISGINFNPKWDRNYEGKNPTVPSGSGSGLKIKKRSNNPSKNLPLHWRDFRNYVYVITSKTYPILYVGITETGLQVGLFGQGRFSHHLRKLFAIKGKGQGGTDHTTGWRDHAGARHRDICTKLSQEPEWDFADVAEDLMISIGAIDGDGDTRIHEGFISSLMFKELSMSYPGCHFQALNTAQMERQPIEIQFPENLSNFRE